MSGIKLTFTNNSNIPAGQDVYIGFYTSNTSGFDIQNLKSGGPAITWIYNNFSTKPNGNWYSLEDLSDGVQVNKFVAGRVYVCYNKAGGGGWRPDPDNVTAEPSSQAVANGQNVNQNFWLRYDKMEMTVTPSPFDVADLTSIDFWAIPMTLNAKKNGQTPTGNAIYTSSGLKRGVTAQKVFDTLLALTNPPISGIAPQIGQPFSSLVPGQFNGPLHLPSTAPAPAPLQFARLIGPPIYGTVAPVVGFPVTPYDTFEAYLDHLVDLLGPDSTVGAIFPGLGGGAIANIAGDFTDTSTNQQVAYNLTANIDSDGNITITSGANGTPANTTIELQKNDLINPAGIYGANPPNVVNGTLNNGLTNDIYGWVIADLLGGLNIGAIGSTTTINHALVGAMASHDWFSLDPSQMYSHLQPAPSNNGPQRYYNQYAAALQPLSDAYNFAFSDRLKFPGADVQVTLNQAEVDELEIVLLDATVTMPTSTSTNTTGN